MSPGDIFKALKSAPKVVGPWNNNQRLDVDGKERCSITDYNYRGYQKTPDDWTWFVRTVAGASVQIDGECYGCDDLKSGHAQTKEEAMQRCDEFLVSEGWILS